MPYSVVDKPSKYFNTVLYTGDGNTARAVTGASFQPDLVWIKERTGTYGHQLHDRVRGASAGALFSNETGAEASVYPLTSFDTDGFTTGSSTQNRSGYNLVSWLWKANGAGSSNTDGSITTTVSANTTSGFSVFTYTGTGSNATLGHGLGVAPKVVFIKCRSSDNDWRMYHASLPSSDYVLYLNSSGAQDLNNTVYNGAPTSTTIGIKTNTTNNGSGSTYVGYAFAEVKGFSKAFSYVGNGSSDGTFVHLGFRPAFVILKSSSSASGNWLIQDNKRLGYNASNSELFANLSNAEGTYDRADFLSNGFKARINSGENNSSGVTYVGFAVAESPFVSSKGIPCTAR